MLEELLGQVTAFSSFCSSFFILILEIALSKGRFFTTSVLDAKDFGVRAYSLSLSILLLGAGLILFCGLTFAV